jgi:hypothetical protein
MTRREFVDLYEYLQELYDLKELSKRGFDAWFNAFAKIDNDVANKIVELYFLNNSKKPKVCDLLNYRYYASKMLNKKQEINFEKCEFCNGAGVIIVELKKNGRFYKYGYSCICSNSETFKFLKKINLDDFNNLRLQKDIRLNLLKK